MNLELTNKTALVSGSTKGIGFAISENAVDSALQQIRQQVPNANADGFTGDLSTEKAVEDLLKRFASASFC